MKRRILLMGLSALLLTIGSAGCSDDDDSGGTTVGCDWFAGDNCFKQSVEAAAQCGHEPSEHGTLSVDGLSCTFADGTEITFGRTVFEAGEDDYLWDFEITRNGVFCMSFTEPEEGFTELVTSLGTANIAREGMSLQLTCPDGSSYTVPNAMDLMSCLEDLPGHTVGHSSSYVSLSLMGGGSVDQHLFTCSSE